MIPVIHDKAPVGPADAMVCGVIAGGRIKGVFSV